MDSSSTSTSFSVCVMTLCQTAVLKYLLTYSWSSLDGKLICWSYITTKVRSSWCVQCTDINAQWNSASWKCKSHARSRKIPRTSSPIFFFANQNGAPLGKSDAPGAKRSSTFSRKSLSDIKNCCVNCHLNIFLLIDFRLLPCYFFQAVHSNAS